MKNILFALILLSITPLCAMKREKPSPNKESKQQKKLVSKQKKLDKALYKKLDRLRFEPNYTSDITPLLERGANPNINLAYLPCLFLAERPSTVHALFKYGAKILQTNYTESNVFHSIASSQSTELLVLFLLYAQAQGLDLNVILSMKNSFGQTPRSMAQRRGPPLIYPEVLMDVAREDKEKMLLVMADPYHAIQNLYPKIVEEFNPVHEELRRVHIARYLEQTSAQSIHQHLLNREIGRNK